MTEAQKPADIVTSVTVTIHWAEQGGLSLMMGDRMIKSVETEEQLSSFMGGFLKALRGQARHITIPIEDHNRLLEYRDQVRRMARSGSSTKGMAARLSPELSVEPTQPLDDESIEDVANVAKLSRFRSAFGLGGRT